jgi:uncharacterized membrane protein
MDTRDIFDVLDIIEQSVQLAELDTTSEFKVHLEKNCIGSVTERAMFVFEQLQLSKTRQRNAVLIYVAFEVRKFHIVYDQGVLKVLPAMIKQKADHILMDNLRNDRIAEGIIEVIEFLGKALGHLFPYNPCNKNEIDDKVSLTNLN